HPPPAGWPDDVETHLRSYPAHTDQHPETLALRDRRESVEGELVFADLRMNVQVNVAVWRRDALPCGRRDADHIADSAHIDDHVISSGTQQRPAEMCDHRAGTAAE